MNKRTVPEIVVSRTLGRVVEARNYFGSFLKFEVYDLAGARSYFRLLYCRWKLLKLDENILDSQTCNSNDAETLRFLVGLSIEKLEIHESRELQIGFEGGIELVAWADLSTYDDSDEVAVFFIDEVHYQLSPRMTFYTGEVENPH